MEIILRLLNQLALVTWLGGLIYICFVLPPMPDQDALPPVFVRMLGLQRFRVVNQVALGVLVVTLGIVPLLMIGPGAPILRTALSALRLLLLLACVVSSVQLHGFLGQTLALDRARPVPAVVDDDPSRVDKLLRQIQKASRAMVLAGLAVAVISPFL